MKIPTVNELVASVGGRKFGLAAVVLICATIALVKGLISPEVWATVVLGAQGGYTVVEGARDYAVAKKGEVNGDKK